jgi:hypothetical protein
MLLGTMKTIVNIMAFNSADNGFDKWWSSLNELERAAIMRELMVVIGEHGENYSE